MRSHRLGRVARALVAFALLAIAPGRATAAPVAVVVTPNASFAPGGDPYDVTLEITQGGTLLHANYDAQAVIASSWGWHAVVADDVDEDQQPLFASDLIGFGQSDVVDGVELLAPGDYRFHCQSHSDEMRGTLRIV